MAKKSDKTTLIYKDFESLFQADIKKKQNRTTKSLQNDFEKLIQKEIRYEKSHIAKVRKKVSASKSKTKIIKTRVHTKNVVNKKLDIDYTSFQKDFMLPVPLKMTKKMLTGNNFSNYLHDNFHALVKTFFLEPKNFHKNKYTLATLGYHFFFKRGDSKTYQTGFRKPRQLLTKENVDKVIKELFKQTFERFDVYFKTRGSSSLLFEGLTAEVSFDTKSKRKK